jgi:hypothetical protein
MKTPFHSLVIDTMPRTSNRGSPYEGEVIKSFMENLGWKVKLVSRVLKKKVMTELYDGYRYDVIHLATHGDRNSIEAGQGRRGWVTVEDIEHYFTQRLTKEDTHLDDTLVVLNAGCSTGSETWVNLFIKKLKAKYYIAPRLSVNEIEEGILFPLAFYMRLRGRRSVNPAFNYAKLHYFSSGEWILRHR